MNFINEKPFVMVLTGKMKSGKSHLLNFILSKETRNKPRDNVYNNFQYGLIFSKTLFNDNFDFMPKKYLYSNYNEQALKNLLDIQAGIRRAGKVPPPAVIVFDDMIVNDFRSKFFESLIFNHRHYNTSVILCSQYCNAIPADIRSVATYAIVFKQRGKLSINACYESYLQLGFDRFLDAKEYINQLEQYEFIFVDNSFDTSIFEEMFKIMKAPAKFPQPRFKKNVNIKMSELRDA